MFDLLKKRRKSGFTLIELIIAITVAVILLAAITTTLMPSIRFFQQTARWGTDKSASNTIYRTISEKLRYSSDIKLYKNYDDSSFATLVGAATNIDDNYLVLKIKNDLSGGSEGTGRLQIASVTGIKASGASVITDLYAEAYYSGRNFNIDVTPSGSSLKVVIEVTQTSDPSTVTHKSENTIALPNASVSGSASDGMMSTGNFYMVYRMPANPTAADGVDGDVGGETPDPSTDTDTSTPSTDTDTSTPTPDPTPDPTPTLGKIEAETGTTEGSTHKESSYSSSGGTINSQSGDHIRLDNGGKLKIPVSVDEDGTYNITVRAASNNKTLVYSIGSVSGEVGTAVSWSDYTFSATLTKGSYTLVLASKSSSNYNVCVDYVEVTKVGGVVPTKFNFKTSATAGGTISGDLDGSYDKGKTISVKATANTGYEFEKWVDASGNQLSKNPDYSFKLEKDTEIKAVFQIKSSPKYNLTLNAQGGGRINGSPSGSYDKDAKITLTADPDGKFFVNWTDKDGKELSTDTEYTFNIISDTTITANFVDKRIFYLKKDYFASSGTSDTYKDFKQDNGYRAITSFGGYVGVVVEAPMTSNYKLEINSAASSPKAFSIKIYKGTQRSELVESIDFNTGGSGWGKTEVSMSKQLEKGQKYLICIEADRENNGSKIYNACFEYIQIAR